MEILEKVYELTKQNKIAWYTSNNQHTRRANYKDLHFWLGPSANGILALKISNKGPKGAYSPYDLDRLKSVTYYEESNLSKKPQTKWVNKIYGLIREKEREREKQDHLSFESFIKKQLNIKM